MTESVWAGLFWTMLKFSVEIRAAQVKSALTAAQFATVVFQFG
jgi:hypothetical protein